MHRGCMRTLYAARKAAREAAASWFWLARFVVPFVTPASADFRAEARPRPDQNHGDQENPRTESLHGISSSAVGHRFDHRQLSQDGSIRISDLLESSGPGEFHPQALSDPDGRLSPHPALMIQSPVVSRAARGRTASDRVALPDPANRLRWWSDASTVCISAAPI